LFKTHVPQRHWGAQVKIPMYGCDCYAYGLLAAGHCDLVVEADLKPYDFMALVPVVRAHPYPTSSWRPVSLTCARSPLPWTSCLMPTALKGEPGAHTGEPASKTDVRILS